MNAIMDVNGKTNYQFNDNLPASDTVLWSSVKTSKFFWKNIITLGSTLFEVTPFNTTTVLTIPFTGNIMMCVQGNFLNDQSFNYTFNGKTELNIIFQNIYNGKISGQIVRNVVTGDTIKFACGAPNAIIQVYQI